MPTPKPILQILVLTFLMAPSLLYAQSPDEDRRSPAHYKIQVPNEFRTLNIRLPDVVGEDTKHLKSALEFGLAELAKLVEVSPQRQAIVYPDVFQLHAQLRTTGPPMAVAKLSESGIDYSCHVLQPPEKKQPAYNLNALERRNGIVHRGTISLSSQFMRGVHQDESLGEWKQPVASLSIDIVVYNPGRKPVPPKRASLDGKIHWIADNTSSLTAQQRKFAKALDVRINEPSRQEPEIKIGLMHRLAPQQDSQHQEFLRILREIDGPSRPRQPDAEEFKDDHEREKREMREYLEASKRRDAITNEKNRQREAAARERGERRSSP